MKTTRSRVCLVVLYKQTLTAAVFLLRNRCEIKERALHYTTRSAQKRIFMLVVTIYCPHMLQLIGHIFYICSYCNIARAMRQKCQFFRASLTEIV
jgi:hypothetical protein